MLFLLGMMSRASTILFVIKQGAAGALRLARSVLARVQRLDLRHRREGGTMVRKPAGRASQEDDEGAFVCSAAWA